jgi:putative transposase
MSRKRFTAEKVIGKLREAEVSLAQGKKVGEVCRSLGISEQSYYRWHREYGGLKSSQAKRIKELERENSCLKKSAADLTLDKLNLRGAGMLGARSTAIHPTLRRDAKRR